MKKLTELQKMKHWLDAEVTMLHVMFAVVMLQLTEGWVNTFILSFYITWCVIYALVRIAYIAADDPDYLKAPKK